MLYQPSIDSMNIDKGSQSFPNPSDIELETNPLNSVSQR